jgi:NADH:ubiquinone oxidoreductase subunit F (NADH-binding)
MNLVDIVDLDARLRGRCGAGFSAGQKNKYTI